MKHTVNFNHEKRLRLPPQLLMFLLLAAVMAAGLNLSQIRNASPEAEFTLKDEIALQADSAMEYQGYQLVIEESGPDYSLHFSGLVKGGRLYGVMEKYDLHVFAENGRYYVRGAGLFEQWQPVEEAELDGLSAFIRDPAELLTLLMDGDWLGAEQGPSRLIEGVPCHTYLLEISLAEIQGFSPVSSADDYPDIMRVYLWFGEEDNFLYRMALLHEISGDTMAAGISRVFTMNPVHSDLPGDLPSIDNRLKI